MDPHFFNAQILELRRAFPNQFCDRRVVAIAKEVRGLPDAWFADVVRRMIVDRKPHISIKDLAKSERSRQRSVEESKNMTASPPISKFRNGPRVVLEQLQATSLWEAVENARKAKSHEQA